MYKKLYIYIFIEVSAGRYYFYRRNRYDFIVFIQPIYM